jgi:hypothetical protein
VAVWCQANNLSLDVSKTKELVMDYRKLRAEHAPIHIEDCNGKGQELHVHLCPQVV